jgi:hypothetical protein
MNGRAAGCDRLERLLPAGDLYECYVVGPESTPDPANWRTELSRPVTE